MYQLNQTLLVSQRAKRGKTPVLYDSVAQKFISETFPAVTNSPSGILFLSPFSLVLLIFPYLQPLFHVLLVS
jgi:hypothetical protein